MQKCTFCFDYGWFMVASHRRNRDLRRTLLCFMVAPAPVTRPKQAGLPAATGEEIGGSDGLRSG
jgi:hypothetical protein